MTSTSTTGRVALTDLREAALSVDEVLAAVQRPNAGAVASFVGIVRDHDHGRGVNALDYSAHPSAAAGLVEVCEQVAARHTDAVLAAVHRVGRLNVGDLAVVVAASSPHRAEAFAACRDLIDSLKATVPIWKHQTFDDGDSQWVGLT